MNVLNSKPQINLKNHISNKNKGESIRYCPKITVPNTLALSVGGGDGSRTIKNDRLSSKMHLGCMKERRNNAALLGYVRFVFLHLEKRVLPNVLPESPLSLFECRGGSGSKIFPLTVKLVPIHSGSVHVLAMAHEHLQLAVSQDAGFNTDKGVPQLVK